MPVKVNYSVLQKGNFNIEVPLTKVDHTHNIIMDTIQTKHPDSIIVGYQINKDQGEGVNCGKCEAYDRGRCQYKNVDVSYYVVPTKEECDFNYAD